MTILRRVPPDSRNFHKDEKLIEELARNHFNGDLDAARQSWLKEKKDEEIWLNETYQVAAIRSDHPIFGKIMQINIRRRDGNVIFRDWRHFQDIKNQLAGPECEAVELYPAESRVIDTANKYHLWCILDDTKGIPLGWHEGRHVTDDKSKLPGLRQRPIPKHWRDKGNRNGNPS